MPSLMNLTALETRVKNMLSASAPAAHWGTVALDEAIAGTLEEYSRVRPNPSVIVPANPSTREVTLTAVGGILSVTRVWFPYTAATPEYPPAWVDFDFWWDAGTPKLLLLVPAVPDGTKGLRIWINQLHTLNQLNGATQTTFPVADEGLMVWGACGYACLQRSTELDENTANMAVSTPNYGALADLFFERFNNGLKLSSRGLDL